MARICLLHPGAMGASLGALLRGRGHEVRWVAAGRSAATRTRAVEAGLDEAAHLDHGVDGVDLVISVCPPDAATHVAEAVAATGFAGTFLDANAVAPATARTVGDLVTGAGATMVDGGIVGPPARREGTTRLFLSGAGADAVRDVFAGTLVEPIVVGPEVGAASATKVAYATWTKGSSALLLAVAAYAEAEGVSGPLREEWARSQPDLAARLELVAAGTSPKAWRFAGELADGGRAFAAVGLPDGFGGAAAELYERLDRFRDRDGTTVDEVLAAILGAP